MKRRAYPRARQLRELVLHLLSRKFNELFTYLGNTLNQTVRDINYFLPKPGDYKNFFIKNSSSSLRGVSSLRERGRSIEEIDDYKNQK